MLPASWHRAINPILLNRVHMARATSKLAPCKGTRQGEKKPAASVRCQKPWPGKGVRAEDLKPRQSTTQRALAAAASTRVNPHTRSRLKRRCTLIYTKPTTLYLHQVGHGAFISPQLDGNQTGRKKACRENRAIATLRCAYQPHFKRRRHAISEM